MARATISSPRGLSGSARWALPGAVLVGGVLRFATLDLQSFDHDESVTAGRILSGGLGHVFDVFARE